MTGIALSAVFCFGVTVALLCCSFCINFAKSLLSLNLATLAM